MTALEQEKRTLQQKEEELGAQVIAALSEKKEKKDELKVGYVCLFFGNARFIWFFFFLAFFPVLFSLHGQPIGYWDQALMLDYRRLENELLKEKRRQEREERAKEVTKDLSGCCVVCPVCR